jgi:hypothetical protein
MVSAEKIAATEASGLTVTRHFELFESARKMVAMAGLEPATPAL